MGTMQRDGLASLTAFRAVCHWEKPLTAPGTQTTVIELDIFLRAGKSLPKTMNCQVPVAVVKRFEKSGQAKVIRRRGSL